jgi:ATP-binding cassette subfamily B protein/subfamily B ATP-binding cassette protein MsbA
MDEQLERWRIILFLSYLGSLYCPLETLAYTSSTVQGAAGSARRVWEVLQTEVQLRKTGAQALQNVSGQVQFENVLFVTNRTGLS